MTITQSIPNARENEPPANGEFGEEYRVDRPRPRRRRFQYSLRSMFIVTTAVAALCSALFAGPRWFAAATLLLLFGTLIPTGLIVAVVYARGYLRTFCIGALIPATPVLMYALYMFVSVVATASSNGNPTVDVNFGDTPSRIGLLIASAILLATMGGCGLFAMLVRRLVEPRKRVFVPSSPCWP